MENSNFSEKKVKQLMKILFIGESAVGKTCLMFKIIEKIFPNNYLPTLGVENNKIKS